MAQFRVDPVSGDVTIRYRGLDSHWQEVSVEAFGKVDVVVRARLRELCAATGKWVYEYALEVLDSSEQPVVTFALESHGLPIEGRGPLSWEPRELTFSPAFAWWLQGDPLQGLRGGERLSGLELWLSEGLEVQTLPGLVRCYVRGFRHATVFPDEPPAVVEDARPGILERAATGYTLGPVPMPEGISAETVFDKLRVELVLAHQSGWLASESVFEELSEGLDLSSIGVEGAVEVGRLTSRIEELYNHGLITRELRTLLVVSLRAIEGLPSDGEAGNE